VLAVTNPFLWYTTRASGVVALVLLTATVVLGILTSTRAGNESLPRFAVSDLHRRISLVALVFLALHIVTAAADSFVPIGWLATVVPFTAGYRPLFVGLGTVAFDLLLAVLVTSLLRQHLSVRLWRGVHWLAYACFPIAVAHAVGIGTDVAFGWLQVTVAVCLAAVLAAVGWRLFADPHRGGHRTAPPRGRGAVVTATPADTRVVASSSAVAGRPRPTAAYPAVPRRPPRP